MQGRHCQPINSQLIDSLHHSGYESFVDNALEFGLPLVLEETLKYNLNVCQFTYACCSCWSLQANISGLVTAC